MTVTSVGQVIRGLSLSVTITVNWQIDEPTGLVAVADTGVVPTGKKLPDAIEYVIVEAGIAVVSVAAKVTLVPHCPVVLFTTIFIGQTITGGTPTTVTVNEQVAVLPEASVAVYVTVLTPIGKVDPLIKPSVWLVVTPEQLSVATAFANVVTAPAALVAIKD